MMNEYCSTMYKYFFIWLLNFKICGGEYIEGKGRSIINKCLIHCCNSFYLGIKDVFLVLKRLLMLLKKLSISALQSKSCNVCMTCQMLHDFTENINISFLCLCFLFLLVLLLYYCGMHERTGV